jgi:hypothetical protein
MIYLETVSEWLLEYCSIHSWQDAIEILFFSTIIYTISLWLKQDSSKQLFPRFYFYLTAFCTTYFLDLQILHTALLYASPIVGTLTIMYHQKELQKNFILARKQIIEPQKIARQDWIEILIRSCLVISHQKQEITCIIEGQNDLETILDRPFLLDLHIQKNLLDLLLLSDLFESKKIVWIKKTGNIVSVNATWSESINTSLISTLFQEPDWQIYGTIVSAKTDALIFHINSDPTKNGICYQGEIIKKISAEDILQFIKQVIQKQKSNSINFSKGILHEHEPASRI